MEMSSVFQTTLPSQKKEVMKVFIPLLISMLIIETARSQENQITISGKVLDVKTKTPLSNATIEVKGQSLEMISSLDGTFEFRVTESAKDDSLEVSHIGYKPYKKRIKDVKSPEIILLQDYSTELKVVTVTSRSLSLKEIDQSLRQIKGNLYAYETETTNGLYNFFLGYLEEHGQAELLKQCDYDLSGYDAKTKTSYKEYTSPYKAPANKKDTTVRNYKDFPAINVSHGAATVFCQWLTEQYNSGTGKRKFKKVKFRLPTLQEWQIAALGYPKFQSWSLEENTVEVVIPADTLTDLAKGQKSTIQVSKEILYPWWPAYKSRRKPVNSRNCYLGNFKIPPHYPHCLPVKPGLDGWTKMANTASYFPNNMGLFDVVGNVAEMLDEKGKACGGSWNDLPGESTIHSIKSYKKPNDTIGFRVFMEVIE